MPETGRGLGEFVKRVMVLKGLTQKDVQRMSGDRITDGYVASITTGRAENLSVDKIQALADGLGVDADELFHVACGTERGADGSRSAGSSNEGLMILEIVQKVVASPDVTEILNHVVRLSPAERRTLLKSLAGADKISRRATKR